MPKSTQRRGTASASGMQKRSRPKQTSYLRPQMEAAQASLEQLLRQLVDEQAQNTALRSHLATLHCFAGLAPVKVDIDQEDTNCDLPLQGCDAAANGTQQQRSDGEQAVQHALPDPVIPLQALSPSLMVGNDFVASAFTSTPSGSTPHSSTSCMVKLECMCANEQPHAAHRDARMELAIKPEAHEVPFQHVHEDAMGAAALPTPMQRLGSPQRSAERNNAAYASCCPSERPMLQLLSGSDGTCCLDTTTTYTTTISRPAPTAATATTQVTGVADQTFDFAAASTSADVDPEWLLTCEQLASTTPALASMEAAGAHTSHTSHTAHTAHTHCDFSQDHTITLSSPDISPSSATQRKRQCAWAQACPEPAHACAQWFASSLATAADGACSLDTPSSLPTLELAMPASTASLSAVPTMPTLASYSGLGRGTLSKRARYDGWQQANKRDAQEIHELLAQIEAVPLFEAAAPSPWDTCYSQVATANGHVPARADCYDVDAMAW